MPRKILGSRNPKWLLISTLAVFGVLVATVSVQAGKACGFSLEARGAYKTSNSRSVWYISDECAKRPIRNPEIFFSHFNSWKDIKVVSDTALNSLPNDRLGFMSWGSLRDFLNGSLVKTVDDPRIYLILSGVRYPVVSESVFSELGFKFGQVEDVTSEVMNKYTLGNEIKTMSDYPQDLIFKFSDGPELYLLDRGTDGNLLRKRYINSFNDVKRDYRLDNIAVIGSSVNIEDSDKGDVPVGVSLRAKKIYNDSDTPRVEDDNKDDNKDVTEVKVEEKAPPKEEVKQPQTTGKPDPTYCGNGELDPREVCDPAKAGQSTCNYECTGYRNQTETNNQNQTTNNNNTTNNNTSNNNTNSQNNTNNQSSTSPDPTYCGNGELDPREVCDPTASGQSNCNSQCTGYNSSQSSNQSNQTNNNSSSNNSSSNNSTQVANSSCSLDSLGLTGKTYYFCDCGAGASSSCVPGSSSLTASQDPANPGRSINDVKNLLNTMSAGDKVALCQGGSFTTDQIKWFNTKCTAGNRCGLVDYKPGWASASSPLPVLNTSLHGIAFEDGGNSDADGGYVVSNINLRATNSASTGNFGVYFYNDADDVNLCGLRIEDYEIGLHIAGSNAIATGNGRSERISLKNSQILDNSNMGWLGGCDDCVISNNIFDNNGFRPNRGGIYSHSIYVSGYTNRMLVSQNTITKSVHAHGTNSCHGAPIVVHGHHDSMLIEKNHIEEAPGTATQQCWGIEVGPGYDYVESFTNIQVKDNTIKYVGNQAVVMRQCDVNCSESNNQITPNTSYMPYVNP